MESNKKQQERKEKERKKIKGKHGPKQAKTQKQKGETTKVVNPLMKMELHRKKEGRSQGGGGNERRQ